MLLFLSLSLWLGVLAARRRTLLAAFAAGLSAGLAYLARPEGLVAIAVLAPWLALAHGRAERRGWTRAIVAPLVLLSGFLVTGGPYLAFLSLANDLLARESVDFVVVDLRSYWMIERLAAWGWLELWRTEGTSEERIWVYVPRLPS